jgi:glycerate 2-kinase
MTVLNPDRPRRRRRPGAVVMSDTLARACVARLDPRARLVNHDGVSFFDGTGDLIRTGPTGTNVNHIRTMLITRDGRQAG